MTREEAKQKAEAIVYDPKNDMRQYMIWAITSALLEASGEPQPIETAQRDTQILIYGHWDGEIHADIYHGWASAKEMGAGWASLAADGYTVFCDKPEAWMPLPSPPEKK